MTLKTVTYEWEDGKTLRLSPEQLADVRAFVANQPDVDRCLRWLAELPGAPEVASAEREACAKIADAAAGPFPGVGLLRDVANVASAIRARGKDRG